MATVFRRGDVWIAQWYRPDGSRPKRSTGCTKRREAERAASELEIKDRKAETDEGRKYEEILSRAVADAKAGKLSAARGEGYLEEIRRVSDPSYRVVSLEGYLASWSAAKATHVGPSTAEIHADMQRRMAAALGPKVMRAPVSDLTRAQIEHALGKIKDRGKAGKVEDGKRGLRGATVNLDLRMLRQALKQAQEDGLVARNVAAGVKALSEDDSRERAPFEAAEVRRMMDHGPVQSADEWRGLILFGAHTGLRLGDVVKLGREHIDGTALVLRPGKTKRSKKMIRVPLTPPLLAWIADRKGAFFPNRSKVKMPALSAQFTAIMKRAGVPPKVVLPGGIEGNRSFHSLRHSFTSWLAAADVHADVRQKLTGHSSASVHANYTHHDEALERAVLTLPDLAG